MSVTIKDIARAAGVSHTTVSRALRGNPAIASSTIDRIQRIASELGYVPNTVARNLKTKRSGVVGVIVRRIVDPFFSEVLAGIEHIITPAGYGLFLANTNRDPNRERAIIRMMSERRVDGVIICSTEVGLEHRRQLSNLGVPSVMVNNQAYEQLPYSIYNDDVYGSQVLTDHLVKLGHRRIGFINNERAGRTTQDRQRGYERALKRAGLPFEASLVTTSPNGRPDGGALAIAHFTTMPDPPTAIVCFNDMVAVGAIGQLTRDGYSVPADFSITGFDNIEISPHIMPSLTTFAQPKFELGRRAAEMMLALTSRNGGTMTAEMQKSTKRPADDNIFTVRGELLVRDSTAAPILQ